MFIKKIKDILNRNKYIPYGKHEILKSDINYVVKALKNDFITQGPTIELFEKEVAKKVNSSFAVSCNSATSALHIACLALGLKEGDWLWTSPITFIASANCGIYCGAKIDFVDINPLTGLMCANKLEEKLKKAELNGTIPKILIPVHLSGTSCDMRKIYELSKKYGFSIIEDASHAIGGEYESEPIGNCKYSSIVVFSFHPVKIITCGEGGMATTNSELLKNKMKKISTQGVHRSKSDFIYLPKEDWLYEQDELGYNYRLTDFQCALGLSQLNRLNKIVKKRNKKHNFYKEITKSMPIKFLETPKDCYSSHHLSIIRLNRFSVKKHNLIMKYLRKKGIGVTLHYYPVHLQPFYRKLGFNKNYLKEAEKYPHNSLSLPLFTTLKRNQQIYVINKLKSALDKYY